MERKRSEWLIVEEMPWHGRHACKELGDDKNKHKKKKSVL